jgi:hypothetical protein
LIRDLGTADPWLKPFAVRPPGGLSKSIVVGPALARPTVHTTASPEKNMRSAFCLRMAILHGESDSSIPLLV